MMVDPDIVVLTTAYNVRRRHADRESVLERNLRSVFAQTYERYRIIYVDDASTDGTGARVADLVRDAAQQDRVEVIRNRSRMRQLHNRYRTIHTCSDHEVVVNLDGDDWFAHDLALARIAAEYRERDAWLTYGQYTRWCPRCVSTPAPRLYRPSPKCEHADTHCAALPPSGVIAANRWRDYIIHERPSTTRWVFGHPLTFFAGLFKQIDKRDLCHHGEFFSRGTDIAMTVPMVEMAGAHVRFIPDVLYVYNNELLAAGRERDADGSRTVSPRDPRFYRYDELEAGGRYSPLDRLPWV